MQTLRLALTPLLFVVSIMALSSLRNFAAEKADLQESLDRRYDQNTYLTAHNAYANADEDFALLTANQRYSIKKQLDAGVRCLALDIYIVRQRTFNDDFGVPFNYGFERYESRGAYLSPGEPFEDTDPEIVVAHEPDKWGYALLKDAGLILRPFRNLYAVLTNLKEWMDENPSEVVTITFESRVHEPSGLYSYFAASGLDDLIFWADRPNEEIPGPDGTGWNVPVHGWPRLRHMVDYGKRLVLFSDDGVIWTRYSGQPIGGPASANDDGLPHYWNFVVENNYGNDSIDSPDEKRSDSLALNDMLVPLSAMNWFPDANLQGPDAGGGNDPDNYLWNFGNLNSYKVVSNARDRFAAAAGRYPNFISVDYYHKGGDGGPSRVVKDCNTYWAHRPMVSTAITVLPNANFYGWHKSVQVVARSFTGHSQSNARWINYYWHGGNDILGHSEAAVTAEGQTVSIALNNGRATTDLLGTPADGIFRISAESVTPAGDRSDRVVRWVRVDGTAPTVQPLPSRAPDHGQWYNQPLTINVLARDLLSRARIVWWTNAAGKVFSSESFTDETTDQVNIRTFSFNYDQEGSAFVQFRAEDFAGNESDSDSGFIQIHLDLTAPNTTVANLTTGGSETTVTLQASDTLSGVSKTWYALDDGAFVPYTSPVQTPSSGAHTLRFYSEDAAGNVEAVRTFRIGQTAVSLSSERNPAGYFQALEITATVRGPATPPTGTVTFFDGATEMLTVDLDATGTAKAVLTPLNYRLSRGSHELTARYNGDGNYAPNTSAILQQGVVDPPGLSLTVSANRLIETQPLTLTANIWSEGELIPTGVVEFRILNGVSGREVLRLAAGLDETGEAVATTRELPPAYYIIFADYLGDAQFPKADSGSARELTVDQAVVSLAVSTSPNPSRFGDPVTFTIEGESPFGEGGTFQGSVRIEEQDTELVILPLDGTNRVSFTTSGLEIGQHFFVISLRTAPNLRGFATHQHQVEPQEVAAPRFRDIAAPGEDALELLIDVVPGRGVQVEVANQLGQWSSLTVGTNTGAILKVEDTQISDNKVRIYRARLLE